MVQLAVNIIDLFVHLYDHPSLPPSIHPLIQCLLSHIARNLSNLRTES